MTTKLDHDLLQEALYNLIEIKGVRPNEITEESGVHNIQDTASGLNKPYKSTWLKLHRAYPSDIPTPTYINTNTGVRNTIHGAVSGTANQAHELNITNNAAPKDDKLTPEELTLIRLVRTKDNPLEICLDFIEEVRKRD